MEYIIEEEIFNISTLPKDVREITGKIFKAGVNFDRRNNGNLIFKDCVFEGISPITFNDSNFRMLGFKKCTFNSDLRIELQKNIPNLDIYKCDFQDNNLDIISDATDVTFVNSVCNEFTVRKFHISSLEIILSEVGTFKIESSLDNFKAKGTLFNVCWLDINKVRDFVLESHSQLTGEDIQNEFNLLQLSTSSKEAHKGLDNHISKARVKKMNLIGLNEIKLNLFNLEFIGSEPELMIMNSDLTKAKFMATDLRNVKMKFTNSSFSPHTFNSVLWSDKLTTWDNESSSDELGHYMRLKSLFSHLKKVHADAGNEFEARDFLALEKEALIRLNKVKGGINWLQKAEFWITVKFLGKYADNWGRSLAMPFFWMLMIHTLLCFIYFYIENSGIYNLPLFQYDKYLIAKKYFNLLYIFNSDKSIVGMFMRIFSGIFIWHIVKVSRRYNLK